MPQYTLGTIHISKKTHLYIAQVLNSKRLSYGSFCQKFEQQFAKLHQCNQGIVCSSGTSALHLILEALKILCQWPKDSEVIIPATTFVATVNAVLQAQLKPVFVDVEASSFNLDPNLITQKISPKTKAIIAVHLFGKPAKMNKILSLAKKNQILVIEDCCETIGASYQNKMVGSFGVAGAFSTNSAHILATGIGGVITTNHKLLAQTIRSLINHGRSINYLSIDDDRVTAKTSTKQLNKIIESRFMFELIGYSYKLSELEAAVGLAQLDDLSKLIEKRVKNVEYLNSQLKPLTKWLKLPIQNKTNPHVYIAYPLVLTPLALIQDKNCYHNLLCFLERNNIETRPLMPLINQPAYEFLKIKQKDFPISSKLIKTGFYVGCHQDLKKTDLDYFVDIISQFFHKFK